MPFTLVIVGRPNVGKSTLFNRLIGARRALVDDTAGVTRDWREGDGRIGGLAFRVIDTAGWEEAEAGSLQSRMTRQTETALAGANLALLVVDGRAGITPIDREFARTLRKLRTRVIVVVNKAESGKADAALHEAYGLGFGAPVALSAEHGEGMAELAGAIQSSDLMTGTAEQGAMSQSPAVHIAVLGRPNVGKSTLINRILGHERVLTGPEAGITRDAVAVVFAFNGQPLCLIDTAGMRRKPRISEKLEKLSVGETLHALRFAHVAVVVVDAQSPLDKQDNAIAALVEREGRAMVLAVNKWDTVSDPGKWLLAIERRLESALPQARGIPVVPLSARTGYQVEALLSECLGAYERWNAQIGTGELNRWLADATARHSPPLVDGRRIKLRYITQKSARPPTFILFSNFSEAPEHYVRYLVNDLRETFQLPGVPIRLRIRKKKNPYD